VKGIYFGSHGLQHDIIPTLSKPIKKNIVFESLNILKKKAIRSTPFFSYPNGDWDIETLEFLRQAGYHGAVTTKSGVVDDAEPFILNRIGLSETSSNTPELLWFQIAKAFFTNRLII